MRAQFSGKGHQLFVKSPRSKFLALIIIIRSCIKFYNTINLSLISSWLSCCNNNTTPTPKTVSIAHAYFNLRVTWVTIVTVITWNT